MRLVLLLYIFMCCATFVIPTANAHGAELPDFELKDIDGNVVRSADLLASNSIIVFTFWEVGSRPCNQLLPYLHDYAEEFKDDGVLVVVISRDSALTLPQVAPFFTSNRYTFPVLLDTDQSVSVAFGVNSCPMTFIVASNGEVILQHSGFQENQVTEVYSTLRSLVKVDSGARQELASALAANSAAREADRKKREEWLKQALAGLRRTYDDFTD